MHISKFSAIFQPGGFKSFYLISRIVVAMLAGPVLEHDLAGGGAVLPASVLGA